MNRFLTGKLFWSRYRKHVGRKLALEGINKYVISFIYSVFVMGAIQTKVADTNLTWMFVLSKLISCACSLLFACLSWWWNYKTYERLKKPISQFLEVFSCLQIMLQNLKNDSYHYKINCFIKNKEGPDCLSLDSLFVRLYGYQYWWQTEEMPMLMFAIQYTYSCRKDFWTFCCQFHMWEGSNFIETEWLMYCTYHSKGAV